MKYILLLTILLLPSSGFATEGNTAQEIGMPQLDPEFWISQIFWLFFSFALLYWLMAKHALPYVRSILDLRDHTIRSNLEQASQIRSEAEDIKIEYDKNLRQADDNAEKHIRRVAKEIEEMTMQKISHANDEILQNIKVAETDIKKNEKVILADADKEAEKVANIMLDKLDDYVQGSKM